MNDNKLFVIVLVAIVVAIFSVISGMLAANGSPVAAALTLMPLFIAGVCLMKEKVWYLWFIIPPLCKFLPSYEDYAYLIVCCGTAPFLIWNALLRRVSLTWNSIRMLDVFLCIMLAYAAWTFISHPFGSGGGVIDDYMGVKGYVLYAQAAIVLICFSMLKTDSDTLGKVLLWALAATVIGALLTTTRYFLNPDAIEASGGFVGSGESGEAARNNIFTGLSLIILKILIIKYSIPDFIKKPWWILLAAAACVGVLIGGSRVNLVVLVMTFILVCFTYKRWITIVALPLIGALFLIVLSETGTLKKLPYGAQRICSVVPFLQVDPSIRLEAEGSTDWRLEMWKWALDDRETFIRDKVWGDGYVKDSYSFIASYYEKYYGLTDGKASQLRNAYYGQWHSGPICLINVFGFVGLTIHTIIVITSLVYAVILTHIYRYHRFRVPILYLTISFIISMFSFYLLAGTPFGPPTHLISIITMKLLFCCARREGLYESASIRKTYVPLMFRREAESNVS